jgi:microfibrillar-associated protein 1
MEEEGDVPISGDQDIVYEEDDEEAMRLRKEAPKSMKAMNVTLKDVNISKDGKVTVAGREESGRTALEEEDGTLTLLMLTLS